MEEHNSPTDLIQSLGSDDDAIRKKAVFRLQSLIGDPSFTDSFVAEGGLAKLQYLAKNAGGNTLAYTLASFSTMLELDAGWEYVDREMITRLLQFVVAQPLVNILRGAMSILAAVVSHPPSNSDGSYGLNALAPAIELYPTFLEMLVGRLSSADHALCANSLQLINALMRDSIMNGTDDEWPIFIKRLKELGAIKAVYVLMQGSGLQDLAGPLLDFQTLMKTLIRKWKDVPVDLDKSDHKRQLKAIYVAANPDRRRKKSEDIDAEAQPRPRDPEKWLKIGFETSNPVDEFEGAAFMGMADLTDYIQASGDGFRRLLLEQSTQPADERCPIAKASLAVSVILFDHFEIERPDADESHRTSSNYDKIFRPTLLQWPRLHTAGLQAFFRLWSATGAKKDDFSKIEELVRILIEQVVGSASRTQDISEVEQELASFDLHELRKLQMDLLELTHEDVWGQHLKQIKDELRTEALQFMKEQRIRCLLAGAWFPNLPSISKPKDAAPEAPADTRTPSWRFARLSHNRRYLHWADYDLKLDRDPPIEDLSLRIALSAVTEVKSEISSNQNAEAGTDTSGDGVNSQMSDTESIATLRSPLHSIAANSYTKATTSPSRNLQSKPGSLPHRNSHTPQTQQHTQPTKSAKTNTIIIRGHASTLSAHPNNNTHTQSHTRTTSPHKRLPNNTRSPTKSKSSHSSHETNALRSSGPETALLTLHPSSSSSPHQTSEWLDGLLLLLHQAPLTPQTHRLVDFIAKYGLKVRMLNVKFEEGGVGVGLDGLGDEDRGAVIPSREGLTEDYYYSMPGVA